MSTTTLAPRSVATGSRPDTGGAVVRSGVGDKGVDDDRDRGLGFRDAAVIRRS
jgi:hypothetical protein